MMNTNNINEHKTTSTWSSERLFVFAAVGSAVGLGNLWKFPYITGENGGGAFVIVYLLCVMLIGLPLLIAEISLGRAGKLSPPLAMRQLSKEVGANKAWSIIGYNGLIAGLIILSFYTVIAGWGAAYLVDSLSNSWVGISAENSKQHFTNLISNPGNLIFWHSVISVTTIFIVARGLNSGIEKAVSVIIPILFIILIVLLIWILFFSNGFTQSIEFLFTPDFSKLKWESVVTALGHAFFTLSLGFGTMMAYGAYMPQHYSIVRTSLWVVFADTIIALLAGVIIFSIVFGNNLSPNSGPGLLFETLPIAFGKMFSGQLFAILFFAMVILATISSSISMLEPTISWITQKYTISRMKAAWFVGLIIWFIGLGSVFSFNIWQDVNFLGNRDFFNSLDFLTTNIQLPISGLLIAVFAGWVWTQKVRDTNINVSGTLSNFLTYIFKFVAPIILTMIFIINL